MTALSLLLCVLWVRSYFISDWVSYSRGYQPSGKPELELITDSYDVASSEGGVSFSKLRLRTTERLPVFGSFSLHWDEGMQDQYGGLFRLEDERRQRRC